MPVSVKASGSVYGAFYANKSVVRSHKFDVWFNFDKRFGEFPTMSNIMPYHVLSVDIPFATFNRETTAIGALQYSYPVLSKEQPLDIKVTMEEDTDGTIATFIQDLQNSVVRKGYHVPPSQSKLGEIHISILNQQDVFISKYIARDVFFLGASSINSSYDSNDTVRYDITFGTDFMEHVSNWVPPEPDVDVP